MKGKKINFLFLISLILFSCNLQTDYDLDEILKVWDASTKDFINLAYGNKINESYCTDPFIANKTERPYFWSIVNAQLEFRRSILNFIIDEALLRKSGSLLIYEDYFITSKSKGTYVKKAWIKGGSRLFLLTAEDNSKGFTVENLSGRNDEGIFDLKNKEIINTEMAGICQPEKIIIISEFMKTNQLPLIKISSCWMIDQGGNNPN